MISGSIFSFFRDAARVEKGTLQSIINSCIRNKFKPRLIEVYEKLLFRISRREILGSPDRIGKEKLYGSIVEIKSKVMTLGVP